MKLSFILLGASMLTGILLAAFQLMVSPSESLMSKYKLYNQRTWLRDTIKRTDKLKHASTAGANRSYTSPMHFPFPLFRLVLETKPEACDLVGDTKACKEWSAGNSYEFDPHNREAVASILGTRCIVSENCVTVDIGQNVGMFSAHAASLGSYVYGIEPQVDLSIAFSQSIALNAQWKGGMSTAGFATWDPSIAGQEKESDCGWRWGGAPGNGCRTRVPFIDLGEWLVPILKEHGTTIHLVKIDTDSVDGDTLNGFLHAMKKGDLQVESFLFECSEVDIQAFAELSRLGYHLYRLNVHIGAHIFAPSGVDMNHARFPDHTYVLPPYFKEKFFLRQMRSVWEVDPEFFASGRPNTTQLAWPHDIMDGRTQYAATLESWSESISYSEYHHGGPLEAPGFWKGLKLNRWKQIEHRGWY